MISDFTEKNYSLKMDKAFNLSKDISTSDRSGEREYA